MKGRCLRSASVLIKFINRFPKITNMGYRDFLAEFASLQGISGIDHLLEEYSDRFSFQINSRKRGGEMIDLLEEHIGYTFSGKNVLDIGCAYGSFSIEMARKGAQVVGVDVSEKWLMLAELNAYNEVDIPFIHCDASSRDAYDCLKKFGKFDFIVLNDVFEHIYDTDGLLYNLSRLLSEDGLIYYKVPNGLNPRNVLNEGHKKVFGISLLPPDYWQMFVDAPFHIYYRRWGYYRALLDHYNFKSHESLDNNHDNDIGQTRRHIVNDLKNIKDKLVVDNFHTPEQYQAMLTACGYYFNEVERDLKKLAWDSLHHKYRVTFWKGLISRG